MTFQALIAWSILSSPFVFIGWLFYRAAPSARREVFRVLAELLGIAVLVISLTAAICWALHVVAPRLF
jgi:hypothetical protein